MIKSNKNFTNDIGSYELLEIVGKFINKTFKEEDFNRIIVKDDLKKLPYIIYVGFYIMSMLIQKINTKGD